MDVKGLKDLADPVFLAHLRLQTDVYWNKINRKDQQYFAEQCVRIGDEMADAFLAEFGEADIPAIAEQTEIKIRKDDRPLTTETPDFIGGWFPERRRISLNAGIAQALIDLMRNLQVPVGEQEAFRLIFLRTFFAYYAASRHGLPTEVLEPVPVRTILSTREFPLRMADKAAGDQFTDRLAQFPVPVGVLPYLQLVQSNRATMRDVYEMLERGQEL